MSAKILALIPARMGSSRFPGKPLAPILRMPMIGHVYERVRRCDLLSETVVCTCDQEILEYVENLGGKAVMTSNQHERASDRCAEALILLEKELSETFDIVVMVQGDEPMTHPDMITEAVQPMVSDEKILVINLLGKIKDISEFENRNCIKVVCDMQSNALYFSREPIPTRFKSNQVPFGKQVCIIPFRRDFLLEYIQMQATPLEITESIDMLRILEHGMKVKLVPTQHDTFAVDTENDRQVVEKLLVNDPVTSLYHNQKTPSSL